MKGWHILDLKSQMFPSIQIQCMGPLSNLLDQTCQEVRKVQSSESSPSTENTNPDIDLDFEDNSPFQEGIISELIKDWTNHSFKNLMSHVSISMQWKATSETTWNQKKSNYIPWSRLSMDLKIMPRSCKGHKFILCMIDEVTNYLITVPIYPAKSEEIGEALI